MNIIKIDTVLYDITSRSETWYLKIYDYAKEFLKKQDDGIYHRVCAVSQEEAYLISERSYKKYSNKKVVNESAFMTFKNIVTGEFISKSFGSVSERSKFIEDHKNLNREDYNFIFKYKEYIQKEIHHKETLENNLKVGKEISEAI